MKQWLLVLAILMSTSIKATADTYLYISESKEPAIKIYRLHDDGTLHASTSHKTGGAPGSLVVDPKRQYLFASIRSTTSLASFQINQSTGQLTPLNTAPLGEGANAAYVATDRSGKYLASASYSAGKVAVHAIGRDGRISDRPLQTMDTAKTAHATVFDPTNQLVFVPHVAPNAIDQFRFDPSSGKLTEFAKAPGGAENAGPRHLAIHPSGKFAFSSNETGSSVTLYSLHAEDGLRALQTVTTLPADFSGRNTTADVKVHPTGKFIWVSNRGHDSLAGFSFDQANAKLQPLGQTPTEKTPRSFDIDPTGRFLYAAGEGSGKLAAYHVDPATGRLNRFNTYDVGASLSWVLAVSW